MTQQDAQAMASEAVAGFKDRGFDDVTVCVVIPGYVATATTNEERRELMEDLRDVADEHLFGGGDEQP